MMWASSGICEFALSQTSKKASIDLMNLGFDQIHQKRNIYCYRLTETSLELPGKEYSTS